MVNKEPVRFEMFIQCPPGLEKLLSREVAVFSGSAVQRMQGGVSTQGDMRTLVKMNTNSALATRILVRVAEFQAHNLSQLFKRTKRIDWGPWLAGRTNVRIQVSSSHSRIYHTKAAQERVQEALMQCTDARACPAKQIPDLMVHVRLHHDVCTISIDSSGKPLWQRGRSREISAAPIRPNLAAAALQLVKYKPGEVLLDPMCGSGTIVMEAARSVAGVPPGLGRDFAFEKWPIFMKEISEKKLDDEAPGDHEQGDISIFASDLSPGAVGMTRRNLKRMGMDGLVFLSRMDMADMSPPAQAGLWICNPPYGRRLSSRSKVEALYQTIGKVYGERFRSWRLALLCPEPKLVAATGLKMKQVGPWMSHGGLRLRVYETGPMS